MNEEHKHEWKIDDSEPTFDTNPIHYSVYCECGATACRADGSERVHDLIEPEPND